MTTNSQGERIMEPSKRVWISRILMIGAIAIGGSAMVAQHQSGSRLDIMFGFFESQEQSIVIVDAEQNIVFFSPGAEGVLGYNSVDVEGKNMSFLIPQELCPLHDEAFAKRMNSKDKFLHDETNGSSLVVRCSAVAADGNQVPLRMTLRPFEVECWFGWRTDRYVAAMIDKKDEVQFLNMFNGRRYGKGTYPGERINVPIAQPTPDAINVPVNAEGVVTKLEPVLASQN